MELKTGKKLRTGAVIVAAGHKSKNSVFKPLLPVGDSTAIRRIIITLKRAGVSPIVVVTGDKADELEKHISNLQVICLRNEQYAVTQMFSSICMGLNYIEDLCDRVFVLPAKFPVFLRETVQRLMQSDADVVRPMFDGHRGHPVLISSSVLPSIVSYQGSDGLRGALRQAAETFQEENIPVEDKGIIQAIETEGDSSVDFIRKQQIQVHPRIQLGLERDDIFFNAQTAHFLQLTSHTGSMQTACKQMHMSYTKGWKILREAEKQLGFPLLFSRSGGSDGGSSKLTPKGEEFLKRYVKMEEDLKKEGERLFELYFGREVSKQSKLKTG